MFRKFGGAMIPDSAMRRRDALTGTECWLIAGSGTSVRVTSTQSRSGRSKHMSDCGRDDHRRLAGGHAALWENECRRTPRCRS